jgi:NAD-dependent deacetylase
MTEGGEAAMTAEIEALKRLIAECDHIVFFGGAGVSTESDIPDFRSENGIYKALSEYGHRPEALLSHHFLMEQPELFFRFYKEKMLYPDARPNAAHDALARLEADGRLKAVVTQNVDGLHQMAGSRKVLELHGSINRNHCVNCRKSFDLEFIVGSPGVVPRCDVCGGMVRPDVVLYEEALDQDVMSEAIQLIAKTRLLIIGGTSLAVYPAAGLVQYAKGKLALINQSATPYDSQADLVIHDRIGEVLGAAS